MDPGVCGGFTPIIKAAVLAETEHIWFAPHGGHVLGATSMAAVPNGLIVESYPASEWRPEVPIDSEHSEVILLEEPNPIEDGWITLHKDPGIGYVLNEDVARRYEVGARRFRRKPRGRKPEKQTGDLLIRQSSLSGSWV